jgi:hypothetical protein
MCEWGNTKVIEIDGVGRDIDSCIVSIVVALNEAGMKTIASCCGHGKQPGSVVLEDGREIRIMPDFESARKVDELFPPIN